MRILAALGCILLAMAGSAQSNMYLKDLHALHTILKTTPSYKAQIRGNKAADYEKMFERLAADSLHDLNSYPYFYNLAQLLFPIKDNHLGFYGVTDYAQFKTTEAINQYVTTKAFLDYPKSRLNTDSLKNAALQKPSESIEGIYHYDKFYDVALYKSGDGEYTGVVVRSEVNLWPVGQIAMHLYEYAPGLYKAVYGHPFTKHFILQPVEKYRNGTLVNSFFYGSFSNSNYSKGLYAVDHVHLPSGSTKFELKNIASDVQYLRLKSFQLNKPTMERSKSFYDSIKHIVTAPYLIVDLRDNEGGSQKATKDYIDLIKKFSKKGKVYLLLNNGTLSQAELFTLKLKGLNNVVTVGQTTKGMLTYGSNFGKRQRLPSGKFEMYPTDMNGGQQRLQYEDAGIEPDIVLHAEKDWIEQVVDIIRKQ